MIRTLIFMGLTAMCMLISSCFLICNYNVHVEPLAQYKYVRETLKLVKKEVHRTIILTTEKMKSREVDLQIGNEIIDSLKEIKKQIGRLDAISYQLGDIGTKEEILVFAEQTAPFFERTLTNLKSLRDLYDITTYSQFETTAYFPADSFNIPPEKIEKAKKAIEPVAQRIVRFIGDHPRQKFKAVIACSSTSDGQELNAKLCEGRARSVANLLADQIRSKEEFIPNPKWLGYNIIWVRQRKVLPDPGKSTVSIIWNLLPATLYSSSSTR